MTVSSASEHDRRITAGSGTDFFFVVAGYLAVVVMIFGKRAGLLVVSRKSIWIVETASRGTQTLDGDLERCHTNVPQKVMITRYGEAVPCR